MDGERISRRELLRNIRLAGAATWAAPDLTGRPAAASVDRCRKRRSRTLCAGIPCDCTDSPQCGTCKSDVGDGSYSFQRMGDFRCSCAEDVYCAETHPCTSDADCSDFGARVCITNNGCTDCGYPPDTGRVQHPVLQTAYRTCLGAHASPARLRPPHAGRAAHQPHGRPIFR